MLSHFESAILDTVICGIKGLKSAKIAKKTIHFSEQIQEKECIVFEAIGDLKACLSHPKINKLKTYSNNIQQILAVLGIEAARQSLLN
jgi:hypothetical protein